MSSGSQKPDRPWIFRTYAGHSTAAEFNKLYRGNLAKGQTGLSVAFDLPTQTGYDSDHPLARGEVGKVGVPISHLGDMRTLFAGIPIGDMNTSMTINATAAWLMALYMRARRRAGRAAARFRARRRTTSSRNICRAELTCFRPALDAADEGPDPVHDETCSEMESDECLLLPSAGSGRDAGAGIELCARHRHRGARRVKASADVDRTSFGEVVGRISFFVNAGMRFVTELCKMRAFSELWDEITRERYGVEEEKYRRFRYGVQVNSLGLTEQQPENNVYRILIEMLAVVLSKNARARAVQLPAWNEALGLPRPFDQQWSLRMQQIIAYETDLLEYGDLFDGRQEIDAQGRGAEGRSARGTRRRSKRWAAPCRRSKAAT